MTKLKPSSSSSTSLLVIVVDVSPVAWGERDMIRGAQDKKRKAEGKRSIGPAVLMEDVLPGLQAFASAYLALERDAGLMIIGVADQQTAVLHPRADELQAWLQHPETFQPNVSQLPQNLTTGVADLVQRASLQFKPGAAMAAGFSRALCLLNRLLVAAEAPNGVSALPPQHNVLQRTEDAGVLALMGNASTNKKVSNNNGGWAPRIWLLQASPDQARDYNAFMNCAFGSVQQQIVVDGCFLATGTSNAPKSSSFLEQACDLTGGVFLAPSGAAQVGGALTEVWWAVFLAPLASRNRLHLPALNKVDFRARCFESGKMVDLAVVCNQCLSIFEQEPKDGASASKRTHCPTCQAEIAVPKKTSASTGQDKKRARPE